MTVNGVSMPLKTAITLSEFLNEEQYDLTKIAVERNGQIVPKADYDQTMLADGDHLEIVSFVGGG
ncbi:MAG TPA: sulfur carrier protein ThiS [Firmicutes bacterium]|nr:sulfur carrier protein ThiS [Bacillota bacterium]